MLGRRCTYFPAVVQNVRKKVKENTDAPSFDGRQTKNGERSALYFALFGRRFGEPPCSLSGVGPALWRGGTQACLLNILVRGQ